MLQTILGAGGAIGTPLAQELTHYTSRIRLVGRNPKKVNPNDELFQADLTDPSAIDKAIEGSSVVYVVIGFQYSAKIWEKTWPPMMKAVIHSCRQHNARLVFFDNVYLYHQGEIARMTEKSSVNPPSRKGKVRARVASMVTEAMQQGVTALIARAPDFYGPGKVASTLTETVVKNLKKGKKAMWLGNPDAVHQFIFTPDAAKAVALLGNTTEAFGQVWHLPTHPQQITIRQWTTLFAHELGVPDKLSTLPPWMLKVLGWFVPIMAELSEMNYQNEGDYRFICEKFMTAFPDFIITPPEEGVRQIISKNT